MYSNWVNVLDNLAAGGVIDFDAPAYLLDQPARYVGHPKFAEVKTTLKNIGSKAWNFIKKPFVWIANKFNKTP